MKKLTLFLIFLAFMATSKAQITLEQTYPASATLTELALSGYKYYLMDVTTNQCRIYNSDHSLWKTIPLSVPSGMFLYDVKYVSENLFNLDNKLELAYTYYSYDTTLFYYTYTTQVIDEDGIALVSIPGCSFVDVKSGGSSGMKMLAYIYDYSLLYYTVSTSVYSIPGSLPAGNKLAEGEGSLRKAFPNPAKSSVTIPYNLPSGTKTAQLLLINGAGQVKRSFTVDNTFHEIVLQTEDLPKGVYFYQLRTEQGIMDSGKLIHD